MKRIIKIAVAVLVFLVVVIAALPTLLSLPSLQQYLIGKVNGKIPGKVSVGSLQLGWFTGFDLKNLALKDPKGRSVVEVKRISLDEGLTKLIISGASVKKVHIENPTCRLIQEKDGYSVEHIFSEPKEEVTQKPVKATKTEKSASKSIPSHASKKPVEIPAYIDASIENGLVTVERENSDEIRLENISCKIRINGSKEALVSASADISKGKEKGNIALNAKAKDYTNTALANIDATCTLNSIPVDIADTFIAIADPKLQGIGREAIGPSLNASFLVKVEGANAQVKAQIQSVHLQANVAANIKNNEITYETEAPGTIRLDVSPKLIQKLATAYPQLESIELLQPAHLLVTMRPSAINLSINPIQIKDTKNNRTFNIELLSSVENLFSNAQVTVKLDTKIAVDDKLAETTGKEIRLLIKGELPFKDAQEYRLNTLITSSKLKKPLQFALNLNADISKNIKGIFSMDDILGSFLLQAPFEFQPANEKFSLHCELKKNDAPLQPVVKADVVSQRGTVSTTGVIDALSLQPLFDLVTKNGFSSKLSGKETLSGRWALSFPTAFSLNALDADLSLNLSKIEIGTNVIKPIQGYCTVQKGSKKAKFGLKSSEGTPLQVSVLGACENLWNDEGAITLDQALIEVESHIQELPLDLFKHFAGSSKTGEQLEALVGETLGLDAKINVKRMQEGTLQANVHGDNCNVAISSQVLDGKLYLTQPITAHVKLSKDTGKTLFKDINPLLATGIHADHPITVFIDNKGFVVPLKPFSMRGIQVSNVRLDLGKIFVHKGGSLDVVSGLLNLPSEKEMSLWFTPLFIEVRNGVVVCKRVDALLDQVIPIASWGTIDLVSDNVDMVVGVFGSGLARALQLQNLDPNYVLQLPLRGKTSSASIDKTRAVAKIASLRMMETNNQTQALIGGILGLAAAAVSDKEAPVPPPTTQPFPWASLHQ